MVPIGKGVSDEFGGVPKGVIVTGDPPKGDVASGAAPKSACAGIGTAPNGSGAVCDATPKDNDPSPAGDGQPNKEGGCAVATLVVC